MSLLVLSLLFLYKAARSLGSLVTYDTNLSYTPCANIYNTKTTHIFQIYLSCVQDTSIPCVNIDSAD